jgi:hypothetical protein
VISNVGKGVPGANVDGWRRMGLMVLGGKYVVGTSKARDC